jgi:uncharacterized protein YjbI with pentapeptide repeats
MGINWTEAKSLSSLSFNDSILDYAIFQSLSLKETPFINCSIKEADFYETDLKKSSFTGSILTHTTFNKANCTEADFRGAMDYTIDVRETNIKKAKFNLPEALTLLHSLDIILG